MTPPFLREGIPQEVFEPLSWPLQEAAQVLRNREESQLPISRDIPLRRRRRYSEESTLESSLTCSLARDSNRHSYLPFLANYVHNAALTRGTQLAGPKAMQASDIGSNGLVGAAYGGNVLLHRAERAGATKHWRTATSFYARLFRSGASRSLARFSLLTSDDRSFLRDSNDRFPQVNIWFFTSYMETFPLTVLSRHITRWSPGFLCRVVLSPAEYQFLL
jgi:hypothetical protein